MKYEDYLTNQITRAESKWGRKGDYNEIFKRRLNASWAKVRDYIDPETICCMGVRAGTEVFEFKQYYPDAEVYGVELSELVNTIKTHLDVHIYQRDFNHLDVDWQDKFDLVFSNSLDHSYKPEATITEWYRVAKPGGHLFLEFSTSPANLIEHTFKPSDLIKLFPKTKFKTVLVWGSPERDIFTGLFKVIK